MRLKAEGPKILQIGGLYNFRFCVVVDEAEAEDLDNFDEPYSPSTAKVTTSTFPLKITGIYQHCTIR